MNKPSKTDREHPAAAEASRMPPKRLVTLRLDVDMVAWFRQQGPGYHTRINQLLRLYMQASINKPSNTDWKHPAAPEESRMLPKKPVTLHLDVDVVTWFRQQGPGYLKRIDQLLRLYMQTRQQR